MRDVINSLSELNDKLTALAGAILSVMKQKSADGIVAQRLTQWSGHGEGLNTWRKGGAMTDLKTQMPTGSDATQRIVVQPAFSVDLLESALNSGDKPGII